MTARDRLIIAVVLVATAVGAAWMLGIAPKRKEAAGLQTKVASASRQLAEAQRSAAQARAAKARYDSDYAQVTNLGKAVPKSDALPSLLYQLQSAAHGARITFSSMKVSGTGGQTGSAPSSTSSSVGAAALPPGANVGSAGFPTMPFSFVFTGSFFDMERFVRDVQRFVRVNGDRIDVRGRLLSIDAIALAAGPNGFPDVQANISATAYLQAPTDNGGPSAASASPAAPAGSAPASSGGTASEVAG
jgi:Tfp pilus assembly protein PilO